MIKRDEARRRILVAIVECRTIKPHVSKWLNVFFISSERTSPSARIQGVRRQVARCTLLVVARASCSGLIRKSRAVIPRSLPLSRL